VKLRQIFNKNAGKLQIISVPIRLVQHGDRIQSPQRCDLNIEEGGVDRLCGLVVRILGYRSRGPGSEKNVVGLERGPLSLVSTTEELLDRKVAAPV
jgi:hypothetical protein